ENKSAMLRRSVDACVDLCEKIGPSDVLAAGDHDVARGVLGNADYPHGPGTFDLTGDVPDRNADNGPAVADFLRIGSGGSECARSRAGSIRREENLAVSLDTGREREWRRGSNRRDSRRSTISRTRPRWRRRGFLGANRGRRLRFTLPALDRR